MFDIGLSELILLAAIALIVIRPKDLPGVARMVGRFMADIKRTTNEFTSTVINAKENTNRILSEAQEEVMRMPKATPPVVENNIVAPTTEPETPPTTSVIEKKSES